MSKRYTLGPWDFDAELGTLSKDGEVHRLENRASSLLALLCDAGDRLLTYEEIIAEIWNGRIVSQNSIAVVIADIRRAMGDSARNPDYIETIPKRGYRLLTPAKLSAETGARSKTANEDETLKRARWPFAVAVMLSVLALALMGYGLKNQWVNGNVAAFSVSVSPIENQSGDPNLDPLTAAVSDLLKVQIMDRESVTIGPLGTTDYSMSGRLTLWSGLPAVYLSATDATGVVIWTGMAHGPENTIPRRMRKQIQLFMAETASDD